MRSTPTRGYVPTVTIGIEDTFRSNMPAPTLLHRSLEGAHAGGEVDLVADEVEHARAAGCRLVRASQRESEPVVALWTPVANRDRTLQLADARGESAFAAANRLRPAAVASPRTAAVGILGLITSAPGGVAT